MKITGNGDKLIHVCPVKMPVKFDRVVHVDRLVHQDIEDLLADDEARKLSLMAIASYRTLYGDRTDKEYAICIGVQGVDLWCFVQHQAPDEWKVTVLPDKEAQQYMDNWGNEDDLPPHALHGVPFGLKS